MVTPFELAANAVVRSQFPALAQAAAVVGAVQLRGMATVGGALCGGLRCQYFDQSLFWRRANGRCRQEGGESCHAGSATRCVATQATDLAPALLALGATVELEGPDGVRRVPLGELYTSDGLAPYALGPGELLCAVIVPWPSATARSGYRKLRLRRAIDRPLVGLGLAIESDGDGTLLDLRIAVCGVGPAVVLVPGLEAFLGARLDESVASAIGRAVSRWLVPSPAWRIEAAWRQGMAGTMVARALPSLVAVDADRISSAAVRRAVSRVPDRPPLSDA
jgi:4-hydroxybenzoyl-CoA reductase subunit beta